MKKINFTKQNNLVPAIIQDETTGEIYMLGFMNEEALEKTKQTGWVYFWSRTRNTLWMKGQTSGNKLKVKNILVDCDQDTLLIKVELFGKNVCHTNSKSCFFQKLTVGGTTGRDHAAHSEFYLTPKRTSTAGRRSGQDPHLL